MQHDACVERAAAGAHRQAVECGETHRRRDRDPRLERASRAAVAEMQYDHPARRQSPARAPAATRRCIRRRDRGSRSAAPPPHRACRVGAKACATSGAVRWKPVSKHATCGKSGLSVSAIRIGARLCGSCNGASGTKASSSASNSGSPGPAGNGAARRERRDGRVLRGDVPPSRSRAPGHYRRQARRPVSRVGGAPDPGGAIASPSDPVALAEGRTPIPSTWPVRSRLSPS